MFAKMFSWGGGDDEGAGEATEEEKRLQDEASTAAKAQESRDTSPGSSRALSQATNSTNASPVKGKVAGLPDIEYPSPLSVNNTFLDFPTGRPASLDAFYEERGFRSCPTSAIGKPPGLPQSRLGSAVQEDEVAEEEDEDDFMPVKPSVKEENTQDSSKVKQTVTDISPMYWPRTMSGEGLEDLLAAAAAVSSTPAQPPPAFAQEPVGPMGIPPPPAQRAPDFLPTEPLPPPPPSAGVQDAADLPVPLRLAQAFPEPLLGSPEMPTEGSRLHLKGGCRPCAFMYTKGCNNGVSCEFCHLCEPGEKKRRAKHRAAMRKETKVQQQMVPLTINPMAVHPQAVHPQAAYGGYPAPAMQPHLDWRQQCAR
eukprot:TRINITY_DN60958_c0_g1_i1.p1 TRINITY_DN60958_c0_g1~~TRINITY_DN60958_c0_g1_i1.p1  ORF type:complete len:386 (+),score=99.11 TRINITY_DN60958_c0_g1_i1:62-1159(+)